MTWLIQAGLVYKVNRVNKVGIPLSAYQDLAIFKIYFLDLGLLRSKARLAPNAIIHPTALFSEFKGALAENYVLQSLISQFGELPSYWTSNGKAEVDFLIQVQNSIFPVEVKSGENTRSRSLTVYDEENRPELKLRFSMKNLIHQDHLLNIPSF